MREDRRILPYFDLPFQHAAPGVLKAMGRNGGAEAFRGLIGAIRAALPHSVIRSTFLVGFPGETEEDFGQLLDFQKQAALDWLGVFTYSREEGTAAYTMRSRPSKKTACARQARLLSAQEAITQTRLTRFNGIEARALIEETISEETISGTGDAEERLYLGRLMIHAPDIDGSAVIESAYPLTLGQFAPVRTVGTYGVDTRCRTP
jgi:ribosomal protein S12 methylthiotransferase